MLSRPSMLVSAAEKVNMPVPENLGADDIENCKVDYPHFYVFCIMQLNRPMEPGEQFENAEVLMKFSKEALIKSTYLHFLVAGFQIKGSFVADFDKEQIDSVKDDLEKWGIEPMV